MRFHRKRLLMVGLISAISVFLARSAASPSPAGASAPEDTRPGKSLIGVWQASEHFGPELRGELRISKDGSRWTAEIRNWVVPFTVAEERVEFQLPNDLGSFRGRLRGDRLKGFWIQPRGTALTHAYATPIDFERRGSGWVGQVRPLDDSLTLYWVVEGREDGGVTGFLRNPERNIGLFLRMGSVVEREGTVKVYDSGDQQILLTGTTDGDRLSVFFPQAGRTFDFVRIEESNPGFAPRIAGQGVGQGAELGRPPELGDGWSTAGPEQVGMDAEVLSAWIDELAAGSVDSVYSPYLHSVLVARRGKLVLEQYFHGHSRNETHDTRSAGKSFATALVGAVAHHGADLSAETPVYGLLSERAGALEPDPRRERLTVGHLMSMSPGLACDDNDQNSPGHEDRMQSRADEPDWIRYALRLPMRAEPGEQDAYCSAGMHLLAGVLSESTGRWVPDLFDEYLARPLGFGVYHLNLDPLGEGYLGGGMRLRSRDFLKLGQLYLDGGEWQGRRLLSKSWIEESVESQSSLNEKDDYGYGWWIGYSDWHGRQLRTYYASGNGGQLIVVVPELELVAAFQAANYANYGTWRAFRELWLPNHILRAVPPEPTE